MVALWAVSSLPLETRLPKLAHSSCKGTVGEAKRWPFPLNLLLHFKPSSWHLWDEQQSLKKFNQKNHPVQSVESFCDP